MRRIELLEGVHGLDACLRAGDAVVHLGEGRNKKEK